MASFLLVCFLVLLATPRMTLGQEASPAQPPNPGTDRMYEVAASDLIKLDSSPKVEFPRQLAAYEVADKVVIALTISPQGKVEKAKAVSGKIDTLKEVTEQTARKWEFRPYLVNGTPVPVRTEITFNFDNTFDHYHDPDGDVPVHLDEKESHVLIVKSVPPHYPPDARSSRIQGSVPLRVIVGKDGRVQGLHIIRGHPMLAPAAYVAVRQWEFKPYVENGKTVPVDTKVTVDFSLSGWLLH